MNGIPPPIGVGHPFADFDNDGKKTCSYQAALSNARWISTMSGLYLI
jgi:hypothetical protein